MTGRLIRASFPDAPALEMSVSHALLLRVARRELPPLVRLYRPGATVAFGKLDAIRPGFGGGVRAARAHGFEPVRRLPGGQAAAYHQQSIGIDVLFAAEDAIAHVHAWFRETADVLARALAAVGVDARVGEIPAEYCPGAYSVNARGAVKLVGTAQRVVRGAALLGAAVVVRDGASVRAVLAAVYDELGVAFDPATAGSVAEEAPGATVEAVEAAVVAAFGERDCAELDRQTLALARELEPAHRV